MFKKVNWMIWLGAVLILAGGIYFGTYYKAHALSPFDMVDSGTTADEFIPILVPAVSGDAGSSAPTLDGALQQPTPDSTAPDTGAPVIGLVPDRLVIPSIYLDAPVVPVHYKDIHSGGVLYHQWEVPGEFAAGWQDESALLGLPGNTVLNGHHNAYGMVYKDLVKLNVGDVILVYSGGVEFRYQVAAKMLLPERGQLLETRMENARWLETSTDERLTLVTCWPANSNTHRVIIVAFPEGASPPPAEGMPIGQ
jgi:LPXTG-site transpeptidase (sortase) family protein